MSSHKRTCIIKKRGKRYNEGNRTLRQTNRYTCVCVCIHSFLIVEGTNPPVLWTLRDRKAARRLCADFAARKPRRRARRRRGSVPPAPDGQGRGLVDFMYPSIRMEMRVCKGMYVCVYIYIYVRVGVYPCINAQHNCQYHFKAYLRHLILSATSGTVAYNSRISSEAPTVTWTCLQEDKYKNTMTAMMLMT